MSRLYFAAIIAAMLMPSLAGCGNRAKEAPVEYENAVYHWKNYIDLEDEEEAFIKDHHVNRMYVRLFDVVPNFRYGAVPESNVYLRQGDIPEDMEVVPTAFITLEALQEMNGKEDELAGNIYQLTVDMMKAAGINNFNELQIDCDWTESTRESFFNLCESLRDLAHKDGRKLSSTIRLHQLRQPAPPVDSGVLMVYNVGEVLNPNETNSILRTDIVKKYLDKAPKYALDLDVAYPIFSWGVVFKGDRFNRLVHMHQPIDSMPYLKPLHDNIYEVTNPRLNEDALSANYHETFRYETVSPTTLREVKRLVERYLGGRPHRVILYHLDESTIRNYTHDEIASIYK